MARGTLFARTDVSEQFGEGWSNNVAARFGQFPGEVSVACYLGEEMRRVTRSFVEEAAHAWGAWAPVRFQTVAARDDFLLSVAHRAGSDWVAKAMTADGRGAHVRWRPGSFLRLNDVAYSHGGRIVVQVMQHRTF